MVCSICAFQLGGPGLIPGGFKDFILSPGTGCASFVCGPDILLTTNSRRSVLVYLSSVVVHSLLQPLTKITAVVWG